MLLPNELSQEIDQATFDQVRDHIESIKTLLPFLIGLDPKDRRAMLKAGDRSQGFIRKAYDVGVEIEKHLPRSMSLAEFRKDVELMDQLYPLMLAIEQLSQKLSDTYALAASEAYAAALLVYRTGKQVQGSEGLNQAIAELSRRFDRRNESAEDAGSEPERVPAPEVIEESTKAES